jgi:hypothetical protein
MHMSKALKFVVALSTLAVAASSQAAIVVQSFTISPGSWNNSSSPFGVGANPTLNGSVTVDTTNTTGSSFSAINYVTGTKTWAVSDINVGASSVVFSGNTVSQFSLIFSSGLNYVYSNNTAALQDPFGLKFCNGCVSLVDTPAVPEPATWLTMILGFGLAGGALRYARRSTSVRFA